MRIRFIRAALPALAAALWLSGCQVQELAPGAPFSAGAGTGLAVVSLERAGVREFDMLLYLRRVGGSADRPVLIRARGSSLDWPGGAAPGRPAGGGTFGRLAVLELPAGEYEFHSWRGESQDFGANGSGYVAYSEDFSLRFTVQAGRITYLGSVGVLLPKRLNYLKPDNYLLDTRNEQQRDLALFREKYPGLKDRPVQLGLIQPQGTTQVLVYHVVNYGDSSSPMLLGNPRRRM